MVITEPMDSMLSRELRLRLPYLRQPQVIEAEIPGKMGLVMPGE